MNLLINFWRFKEVFFLHFISSAKVSFVAFVGSVFLGFIFYLLMRNNPLISKLFDLLFILFQTLPLFVLAPVFLICFGLSFWSITFPAILMLAFPAAQSIKKAFTAAPDETLFFYRMHGASFWRVFFSVEIPYASPYLFSTLKVAAISSPSAALAGEWVGAQKGLGVLLHLFRRQYDLEGVFTTLMLLFFLTMILYFIAYLIQKAFSYEKTSHQALISLSSYKLPKTKTFKN